MENRIQIAASPERIFGLLIEPRSWVQWWPAVRFARSADFKPLRESSKFEVTLEFGRLRSTLKPKVTLCADDRALVWKGSWMAIPVQQEYYLSSNERGCKVRTRTLFPVAIRTPLRWFRIDRLWAKMIDQQLKRLRRTAEGM